MVDFGRLTDEQTREIAHEALSQLDDTEFVELVVQMVKGNDKPDDLRDELIASLEQMGWLGRLPE